MRYSDIQRILAEALNGLYPVREIDSIGRLVLESLTGLSWVQIRLNQANQLPPDQESHLSDIIVRLKMHEPIQYILGETEFYGLKINVKSGVLIPRGETEELVEWILTTFAGMTSEVEPVGKRLRILDIGCGSGAIAIALAKHLPDAEVVASDISEAVLQLTKENAGINKVELSIAYFNILTLDSLVIPAEAGTPSLTTKPFDIIVSNPPYVPLSEMTSMDLHVIRYEPEMALFVPDANPLLFYKAIAEFAASNLNPGGQVYVEIHDRLGEETAEIFRKWFSKVELHKDIHGKDRMIRAYHG